MTETFDLSSEPGDIKAVGKGSGKPNRILHIGKYFPPHRGGMETVLRDQMNVQSREEGLQVAAVVHSSGRRLTDRVEIQALDYRVRHAARWFTAIFAPIAPFFAWSVHREIQELDPDEIRIHMPNLSAFWLLFMPGARQRQWSVLWHSDVLPSEHSLGLRAFYRVYKPFEKWLLSKADVVIATSSAYLSTSKALQPFREKCVVQPLAVDSASIPREFREAAQAPKSPGEGIRVLSVGRLTYYKDHATLIKAVCAVPGAQCRIVGEGTERKNLEQVIRNCDGEGRVTLMGNIPDEDVWRLYAWCDVHVLASIERTEAFGIVLLEAAQFNKPNIVCNTPGSGMLEAASSSGTPYYSFSPGDVDGLRALLQDPALALPTGVQG